MTFQYTETLILLLNICFSTYDCHTKSVQTDFTTPLTPKVTGVGRTSESLTKAPIILEGYVNISNVI